MDDYDRIGYMNGLVLQDPLTYLYYGQTGELVDDIQDAMWFPNEVAVQGYLVARRSSEVALEMDSPC